MTGPKSPPRRRAPDAPVVLVPLDPTGERPLHRQVYDGLREAILAGRLTPRGRLPSTRALATDLGVARNTVTLAFEQLRAEGYIAGHRGGGTSVRCALPDTLLRVPNGRRGRASSARPAAPTAAAPTLRLSARGAMLAAAGAAPARTAGTPGVAFRLGVPALDAFPAELWARLTARRWRAGGVSLGEADPAGEPALRAAIAEYVTNARGARCTAAQVIVVNGTQQALDLVARLLLDPGDRVWMEDPGYMGARPMLEANGARLVPVPIDEDGLDVRAGERLAPDARLVYVTPSHQFPLGAVMSAERRLALLAWARRAQAWIVEDDYDSEFRYAGRPLPCLQGLDAERCADEPARVLYVGTFSKTLVPGFRLAYLVVPDALVEPFRAARAVVDRHASTIAQGVLADFIGEGHYARHVRRVRALCAERQAVLVAAARESLGDRLALDADCAGLHLVGWLPPGVSDVAVVDAAEAAGVETCALSRCLVGPAAPDARGALLLGYAGFDPPAIRAGVATLGRVLDALDRHASSRRQPERSAFSV